MPGSFKPNKRKQAMTMKNNNTSLTLKNSARTVIAHLVGNWCIYFCYFIKSYFIFIITR